MPLEVNDLAPVFMALKGILTPYQSSLIVERDVPGDYSLNTHSFAPNKQPLFFGAVSVKKNYVSFYLMPVYMFPDLLEGISAPLSKRMQGKSCFNFKSHDPQLMEELAGLTRRCFVRFKTEKLVD